MFLTIQGQDVFSAEGEAAKLLRKESEVMKILCGVRGMRTLYYEAFDNGVYSVAFESIGPTFECLLNRSINVAELALMMVCIDL